MTRIRRRVRRVWNAVAPGVPALLRISPGLWWIARHDAVSDRIFAGSFETAERQLFASLVRPGMVVLDVGAHAGLYTLIAAKRAGATGSVIAFEPSPRERAHLAFHLRLNRRANVIIEPCALGDRNGEAELFVVEDGETGCNSLKPGNVGRGRRLPVPIRVLDDYVRTARLDRIDVIKIDVEGAELSVLRGAERVLKTFRPVVMCEIEEARTQPWGYSGREIVALLERSQYECLRIGDDGTLTPADPQRPDGNYLARPR